MPLTDSPITPKLPDLLIWKFSMDFPFTTQTPINNGFYDYAWLRKKMRTKSMAAACNYYYNNICTLLLNILLYK